MGGILIPNPDAPDPALAGELVEARFGLSTDLVGQYDSASTAAFGALAEVGFSIPMENIDIADIDPPEVGDAPIPNPLSPYESQLEEVQFSDLEALRELLGLIEVTVDSVTLPVLEAQPPSVTIPDAPDAELPQVPTDVPNVTDPDLPAAPDLDLPPVPVLEDTPIPAVPELANVQFEGEMPTADLTPPEPSFVYSEGTYQSDLADALNTKLYNDVLLGGTGLGAEIEADIWARMLSRLDTELDKAHQQVLNNWAGWNQEMPDGILSTALQEVVFEDTRNRLDANRDVTIKQAELAQENTHFAITNGLNYEKQIMDFTNQVAQRAFEVAKFRVQAVIDIFNLKVNAYNAQLEGYKTLAQVFESRIRAELAKVEVYRAQMEGAKIHGELQKQKVDIYVARVGALEILIDLYKAQMEGAKVRVDIDRVRIEGFRASVDAVKAQIDGITAGYNLYQAQIAGESAKVDLYGKQVSAYATQVQAAKVEADVNLAEMQAILEANKDRVTVLTAAIEKYKADTDYQTSREDANAKAYAATVDGYTAEVARESEYIKASINLFGEKVREVMARAEILVKEMDANLRAATASKEIQVEALKAAAQIQAQKVASALSSVSASAQIGFNAGLSHAYSSSVSDNENFNRNDSTTEMTIRNV